MAEALDRCARCGRQVEGLGTLIVNGMGTGPSGVFCAGETIDGETCAHWASRMAGFVDEIPSAALPKVRPRSRRLFGLRGRDG